MSKTSMLQIQPPMLWLSAFLSLFLIGSELCLAHAENAQASHQLVVLTTHNKSTMDEFSRAFRSYYQKRFRRSVKLHFVNQGDEQLNARYVIELLASRRQRMPIDVLWGGSASGFDELASAASFESIKLNKALKSSLDRLLIDQRSKYAADFSWVSASLTGYGIVVNWAALKEKTSDLGTGARELKLENLSFPGFKNLVLILDPRQSKSFGAICSAIIKRYGWDRGLQLIESIIVHSRVVAKRDAAALDALSRGEVGVSFAADYAAYQLMYNQNRPELEYSAVSPTQMLRPDPIARIKHAENSEVAARFVEFVLSREGQSLLASTKGSPNGPVDSYIGRIAIRDDIQRSRGARLINPLNPFINNLSEPELDSEFKDVPEDLIAELLGVVYIDHHRSWLKLEELNPPRNAGARRESWLGLAFLPRQENLAKLLQRWAKPEHRPKIIEQWRRAVLDYMERRLPESDD